MDDVIIVYIATVIYCIEIMRTPLILCNINYIILTSYNTQFVYLITESTSINGLHLHILRKIPRNGCDIMFVCLWVTQ